jgi:hypothetical protein
LLFFFSFVSLRSLLVGRDEYVSFFPFICFTYFSPEERNFFSFLISHVCVCLYSSSVGRIH